MASQNWKKFELDIAKLFKGHRHKRVNYGESDLDVETREFIIECKFRSNVPAYVIKWIDQARKYKTKSNKISMLAWKSKGKHIEDSLIVIRLEDFLALLKGEHLNTTDTIPLGFDEAKRSLIEINKWFDEVNHGSK